MSHAFAPAVGGIETMSESLAGQFAAVGHEVVVVTQTAAEADPEARAYRVLRRPGPLALWRLVRSADAVLQVNVSLRTLWPSLATRKPTVVAIATWIARTDGSRGWQDRLKLAALRRVEVTAVSDAVARSLRAAGVRATVVHNSYRADVFRPRPEVAVAGDLVCVARLVSDKGVDLVLDALAGLVAGGARRTLSVVGEGPERPALQARVARLGLAEQVRFVGRVQGEELAELLAAHRTMVVPSRWAEPFGIVALEGLASGCALVVSSAGGLLEAAGPTAHGFANGDVDDLAAAILAAESPSLPGAESARAEHLLAHTPESEAAAYAGLLLRAAPSTTGPATAAPRVVLIENYAPDRQESMLRYARSLARDLRDAGASVELWSPPVVAGRLVAEPRAGMGKWAGYVDKLILAPVVLGLRARRASQRDARTVFQVCDHSNAPWLAGLPAARTVITCHDVLAIRGARGDGDAHAVPSRSGRHLQRWILRWLAKAQTVVCVSQQTLGDLQAVAPAPAARRRVIPHSLNADFTVLEPADRVLELRAAGVDPDRPFLLHVGSAHPRKNRRMLIDLATVSVEGRSWQGCVVFAGEPIDASLRRLSATPALRGRVLEVAGPTHRQLVALYQSCAAFVFPSFSEGFGWPVIEAQACGAPVVASRREPMIEVGGEGALYADPLDPADFARQVGRATRGEERQRLAESGRVNLRRFDRHAVVGAYLDTYQELTAR